MQRLAEDCIFKKSKDPKIALAEKKSKFSIENPKRTEVIVYQVDGCLIKNGERCDYLILIDNQDLQVFVELKGSEIVKAIGQLANSLEQLANKRKDIHKQCFVIATRNRTPKRDPGLTNAQNKFRKKYRKINATLHIEIAKKKEGYRYSISG
ncbi:hypothetical protein [Leptothoe kymatousa]|uniref:LAGLIDADG homing endonuclease n=1 Tax=Leptothoe kymatousa TAU-MAC 1615 TaxID=2364775 RepID=A0ABS5XZ16_9CYAN|nr:hypothetical protein [Leptothoe kymatousa]MBT9310854.1 hypothetical protein [Leptothoe kymatousa TAU-MAC 1615]